MEDTFSLRVIARLHCDFTTKFGIPRQSGLVPEQRATIVFEPPSGTPTPYGAFPAIPTCG